jgi:hypothetical protein
MSRPVQKVMGENLEVVGVEFSAHKLGCSCCERNYMARTSTLASGVENWAQVLSCKLKFEYARAYPSGALFRIG